MEIRHYIPAEGKDLPGVRYTLPNNGRQEACIYESIRVGRAKGRRGRDKETALYTTTQAGIHFSNLCQATSTELKPSTSLTKIILKPAQLIELFGLLNGLVTHNVGPNICVRVFG